MSLQVDSDDSWFEGWSGLVPIHGTSVLHVTAFLVSEVAHAVRAATGLEAARYRHGR